MAYTKRSERLLDLAAASLLDGCDPFDISFLRKNEVTLDECYSLSEALGIIAKGYLRSDRDDQNRLLTLGATDGIIPAGIVDRTVKGQQAIKKLSAI